MIRNFSEESVNFLVSELIAWVRNAGNNQKSIIEDNSNWDDSGIKQLGDNSHHSDIQPFADRLKLEITEALVVKLGKLKSRLADKEEDIDSLTRKLQSISDQLASSTDPNTQV